MKIKVFVNLNVIKCNVDTLLSPAYHLYIIMSVLLMGVKVKVQSE